MATARVAGVSAGDDAFDDLGGVGVAGLVVQPDPLDRRPGSRRGPAQRLVRRVEVVLGGEHVVALGEVETAVHDAESDGGAGRQRDLVGRRSEVVGRRPSHRPVDVLLDVVRRVEVERLPVAVDRVADHLRRRRQHERGEVGDVGIEGELGSDGLPVVLGRRVARRPRRHTSRAEGAGEEPRLTRR